MNSLDTSLMDNDEEKYKGHNVDTTTTSSLWNQLSSFGVLNLERARQLMILR